MDKRTIMAVLALVVISQAVYAEQDYRKAVVVHLTARKGSVTMDEAKIVYGTAPGFLPDHVDDGSLKLVAKTDKGDVWWARIIQNPRYCQIADEGDLDENTPHYVTKESSGFTVVLPFKRSLRSLTVYGYDDGNAMGSFDLSDAADTFCKKQVYDPDCRGGTAATTSTTLKSPQTTTSTTLRPQPPRVGGGGESIASGVLNFLRGVFG
ncbi:MAG: hypothetical protein V1875_07685 [Candidatus Altiarchaeota archaeon]